MGNALGDLRVTSGAVAAATLQPGAGNRPSASGAGDIGRPLDAGLRPDPESGVCPETNRLHRSKQVANAAGAATLDRQERGGSRLPFCFAGRKPAFCGHEPGSGADRPRPGPIPPLTQAPRMGILRPYCQPATWLQPGSPASPRTVHPPAPEPGQIPGLRGGG
jgi:hypothetical protein